MQLSNLQPKEIWEEFFEICKIPHGSGNVDAIRAFIRARAEARGFKCQEDGEAGNLLIIKEADAGFEKAPVICLQGHLDMVCSKRAETKHDFLKDPIAPRIQEIDGKMCVTATGTSLGADDGMGLAAGLAIIFDKSFKCGKIEVLCTKDEETTMHGVHHMSNHFLTAKYLLNLDSEDLGVITIGSAGGFCADIVVKPTATETCEGNCKCRTISVSDCAGGHSGVDIHHWRANAIKLVARICQLSVHYGAKLCCIKGGSAHNAIPMDASACMCFNTVSDEKIAEFDHAAAELSAAIQAEFKDTDPNIKCSVKAQCACTGKCCGAKCVCLSAAETKRFFALVNALPQGVLRMSPVVAGLTESSINLGTMHVCAKEGGEMTLLARSSQNAFLKSINCQLAGLTELAGFEFRGFRDAYGGWAPNLASPLLAATKKHYEAILGKPVKVEAIHAGLECGELISKYPGLEAVSIGPTIKNPHSDRELCEIDTVAPFYQVVKAVIHELSK